MKRGPKPGTPSPLKGKPKRCLNCMETGHIRQTCPLPPAPLIREITHRLEDQPPSLLDDLGRQGLEALLTLLEAEGTPVPGDRLCHQITKGVFTGPGDWSTAGRAQSVIHHVRHILGDAAVLSVRGYGYVLGVLPEGLV